MLNGANASGRRRVTVRSLCALATKAALTPASTGDARRRAKELLEAIERASGR